MQDTHKLLLLTWQTSTSVRATDCQYKHAGNHGATGATHNQLNSTATIYCDTNAQARWLPQRQDRSSAESSESCNW